MKQKFRINRKVINRNYDEKKIQEIVEYAQNLNRRIVDYDKKSACKCVTMK